MHMLYICISVHDSVELVAKIGVGLELMAELQESMGLSTSEHGVNVTPTLFVSRENDSPLSFTID
jgi:hypothetical protein